MGVKPEEANEPWGVNAVIKIVVGIAFTLVFWVVIAIQPFMVGSQMGMRSI